VNERCSEEANGKSPRKDTSALVLAVENGHSNSRWPCSKRADPNDSVRIHALHAMSWFANRIAAMAMTEIHRNRSGNLSSLQFVKELVKRART